MKTQMKQQKPRKCGGNMAAADPEQLVVGIDLGTTNSAACIFLNENLKNLENSEGGRTTPSFVFFTVQGIVVGQFAKEMSTAKPERGVYEIKRLIGRDFNDPNVQRTKEYVPFEIIKIDNEAMVKIGDRNESPVQLSCHILKKIKRDVEAKLNQRVDKAVITVPAYFNVNQRKATLEAAAKAGFTVLRLLNEPTAAALSYYYQKDHAEDHLSLVYDLGGGTFDVSILKKTETEIKIIAVNGDSHLGGADFDKRIIDYVCEESGNLKPTTDRRLMRRLKNKCEKAKKYLSNCQEAEIILEDSSDYIAVKITRKKFEEICEDLFERTMQIVDSCLKAAELKSFDIQNVILAGGSTRIPKIQQLISDYFNGQKLDKFVNPDECVAEGAALQAARLSKAVSQKISTLSITEVVSLSLGIEILDEGMSFIINKNSPLPTSSKKSFVTVENNQSTMSLSIFEGERRDPSKNRLIGTFTLKDLTLAPPGDCSVTIMMELDENGLLTVTAEETHSGKKKNLKIGITKGRLSDKEVENIITDAADNKEADEMFTKITKIKAYGIKYCIAVMYNLDNLELKEKYSELYQKCQEMHRKLNTLRMNDKKPFLECKEEITVACDSVIKEHHFKKMPRPLANK